MIRYARVYPVSRADAIKQHCMIMMAVLLLFGTQVVQAVTLNVVGVDGSTAPPTTVSAYRWLLEEDVTHNIIPGVTCQGNDTAECLSVDFHRSYMPVVAKGTDADPIPVLDPAKRYFISVLPDSGYSIGGAPLAGSQTGDVTVELNAHPIPTAQIRVYVHEDKFPINNNPDWPVEQGLEGFTLLVEDAGGRYGISGQQIITDAFGNPLGTTYEANGDVLVMGSGDIVTDADGYALIQNLAPGKYGIQAVPPTGSGWVQTATIEGSKIVDAWVAADEPPFFTEFGPPGPHVFIGFVQEFTDSNVLTGGETITGQVHSIHVARPPAIGFHDGPAVPGCWVGLNENVAVNGRGVFAAPCDEESNFTIPNVPPGLYQLAIWDKNLDYIFGLMDVNVEPAGGCNAGADCNLGNVGVFAWFHRLEQYVFNDTNMDGFWDPGEEAMPEQGTNIRWRDGTVYQSFPTDLGGAAPYDEVFPFFSWLVAEVDFSRFKATGATIVVDDGGVIDAGNIWSFDGVLNPQPQSDNAGNSYRVETGAVLTQAFQGFLGQTNVIQWGKKAYEPGENGGISGLVYYATTRAEDDPKAAGAEVWEPGIPRIQLALYEDNTPVGGDGVIDDLNLDGCQTLADVDNYPFGNFPGAEDFDYPALDSANSCAPVAGPANGTFDGGDAIQVTTTDSWDDSLPTGCQGDVFHVGVTPTDCFDGLRNFNQIRPGVFDGGYAFDSYVPGGVDTAALEASPIPTGDYIVGVGEHPVYEHVKEEDRNTDFGDEFTPAAGPALTLIECAGNPHTVPGQFSLFPLVDEQGNPVSPPAAGEVTPLCDRKMVRLGDGKNAAAEFFLFTPVPPAGHIVGTALDDVANEFDPLSPSFGEKFAPPYLPISIRDYNGREITRTNSDRWGRFNALVPSSYTNNLPMASGMSPNMLVACINDPGPIPDGSGRFIEDPDFDRQYSQFCYTLQYLPGVTTYLDTPVVPVAAFAGADEGQAVCSEQDGTPVIWSAQASTNAGPYVGTAGDTLTITSAVDPDGKDYGFGAAAGVVTIDGIPQAINGGWSNGTLQVVVANAGYLEITRADGARTQRGLYVTVGGGATFVAPGGSIQSAIDLAQPGDLVVVPPGTFDEMVVMWKPVRLQGSGASSWIKASTFPAQKMLNWRTLTGNLIDNGDITLLPDQGSLTTEEGPGIFVSGMRAGPAKFALHPSRIDGFTITSGSTAGGILVNGYARNLEVSNNRVMNNYGIYGGGIRLGHPLIEKSGVNGNISIHHNSILQNGATRGAGGGVSLYSGSDGYKVRNNFICGNFTQGNGAGIGHLGNNRGSITHNQILFNQSFNQGVVVSGGGVYISGIPSITGLTEGAGRKITIDSNLIQGNQAAAGDGGGIATAFVSGLDAVSKRFNAFNKITISNNIITNNMAGHAGGGISMVDTPKATIYNNTIVHNDSVATSGESFAPGSPNQSTPQPAGIVAYGHSAGLQDAMAANPSLSVNQIARYGSYSKPTIRNSILWRNRSFYYLIDVGPNPPTFGLVENTPQYWDMGVIGSGNAADKLRPIYSVLTDITGRAASNIDGSALAPAALFQASYVNTGNGEPVKTVESPTTIVAVPAFDEGGNFIDVRYGPLELSGDYHLAPASVAANAGIAINSISKDFDGDARPMGAAFDIGADEAE